MSEHQVEAFIEACLPPLNAHRAGSLEPARAMLEQCPELATASVVTAVLTAEGDAVKSALAMNSAIVRDKFPPRDWELLLFLSFSLFYRDDQSRRERFHDIARQLLSHGADAGVFFMLGDEKETALYGATGVANDAILGGMLLDAGADVNDEDASYHIAEHDRCDAIELMFSRGMKPELQVTTLLHKLDYDDLAGVERILDLGVDPNATGRWGKNALHQAIMRGRALPFLELLLERGADVNARRDDGRTPFALAARIGRRDAMQLLEAHGADRTLTPVDQFLSACAFGDEEQAARLKEQFPDLVQAMDAEDQLALVESARDGQTEAVRLMLKAGMDVTARGVCGGTALHWAAWHGHAETVELLVESSAPIDVRCTSYRNSPLGWGVYGSTACRDPRGDYLAVTNCLLVAGAAIEDYMFADGTSEIADRLRTERTHRQSRSR